MKKILKTLLIAAPLVAALVYFVAVPVTTAFLFPGEVRITSDEYANPCLPTGVFIKQTPNYDADVSDSAEKYIDLKLLGLITVKRVRVDILPCENVIAGGAPVGFIAESDGVIVLEDAPQHKLKKGDIIKRFNDTAVSCIGDVTSYLEKAAHGSALKVDFVRGEKHMTTTVSVPDTQNHQLGLWLKDETSGIGVVTYINPANNNFAALGHRLTDFETGAHIDVRGGSVYKCNVVGIDKSEGTRVGEFKSTLRQGTDGKQGSLISSNVGGVFGCLNADSKLLRDARTKYPVGSRYYVRPGKAKLRTCIDGTNTEEYDIEIVKTNYQKHKAAKSLIIRITDKRLLESTGGIVHGMSGSPIIQNGKIVGALTHVIVNDTTKGYGIYIDFVIP